MAEGRSSPAPNSEVGTAAAPEEKKKMIGKYELGELLGEGTFSKVRKAVDPSNGNVVAIKIINNALVQNVKDMERVCREIHVLKNIRHPNIIQLYEAIDRGTHVYMVIEYAAGGELWDYIENHGPIPQGRAKKLFHQVLSAVDYCHRQNVAHRDLKPENIMLDDKLNVKLADFGLSNDMVPGQLLKTICGSPAYSAPEIVAGKRYDGCAVDVWSCGVILYCMCVGRLPFDGANQPELFSKISAGAYTIPDSVSHDCADLIRQFLVVDPSRRISISQAWHHPWLSSVNAGAQICDMDDDDLSSDASMLASLGVFDAAAGGSAADPEFPGRVECCNSKCALPEELLAGLKYTDGWASVTVTIASLAVAGEEKADAPGKKRAPSTSKPPLAASTGAFVPPSASTAALVPGDERSVVFLLRDPASPKDATSASGSPLTVGGGAGEKGSPNSTGSSSPVPSTMPRRVSLAPLSSGSTISPFGTMGRKGSFSEMTSERDKPKSYHSCAVSSKEPRLLVKELQRMFGENKLLLRASGASFVKGDKNKTRFDIVIYKVLACDGVPLPVDKELYAVVSSKIAGDWAEYRAACRKLIWKL